MNRLSVIVPVFNALAYTKKCLEFIDQSVGVTSKSNEIKIVVTDDGSTDGTGEWLRKNRPDVELCTGDGNLWWSGGVNMGIKHALNHLDSEYILLWNNDIRPATNYFPTLLKVLESNPENQIILSRIYMENQTSKIIFSMGGVFNPYNGRISLIGFGEPADTFINPGYEINWFPGMGTTIHRSVFNSIGYFDEKYFPQYKGDSDFALRAWKLGYKFKLVPELEIWNDRENTGFSNHKSFHVFIKSLTSRKSDNNIYRDVLFYLRHGKSLFACRELFRKYFKYIGGFIKWKILGLFGHRRTNRF